MRHWPKFTLLTRIFTSAEAFFHSIPVDSVFTERMAQGPKRHVEFSEKQCIFNIGRKCYMVRHDERWSDSVKNTIHKDSSCWNPCFFWNPNFFQRIPFFDSIWKKLRKFINKLHQFSPEIYWSFDSIDIFHLIKRKNNCTLFVGSWFWCLNFRPPFVFRLSYPAQPYTIDHLLSSQKCHSPSPHPKKTVITRIIFLSLMLKHELHRRDAEDAKNWI